MTVVSEEPGAGDLLGESVSTVVSVCTIEPEIVRVVVSVVHGSVDKPIVLTGASFACCPLGETGVSKNVDVRVLVEPGCVDVSATVVVDELSLSVAARICVAGGAVEVSSTSTVVGVAEGASDGALLVDDLSSVEDGCANAEVGPALDEAIDKADDEELWLDSVLVTVTDDPPIVRVSSTAIKELGDDGSDTFPVKTTVDGVATVNVDLMRELLKPADEEFVSNAVRRCTPAVTDALEARVELTTCWTNPVDAAPVVTRGGASVDAGRECADEEGTSCSRAKRRRSKLPSSPAKSCRCCICASVVRNTEIAEQIRSQTHVGPGSRDYCRNLRERQKQRRPHPEQSGTLETSSPFCQKEIAEFLSRFVPGPVEGRATRDRAVAVQVTQGTNKQYSRSVCEVDTERRQRGTGREKEAMNKESVGITLCWP